MARPIGIDALIEKKERLLTLLAEKRDALIHKAVTKGFAIGFCLGYAELVFALGLTGTTTVLTRKIRENEAG